MENLIRINKEKIISLLNPSMQFSIISFYALILFNFVSFE
jgi:hypothetical protein